MTAVAALAGALLGTGVLAVILFLRPAVSDSATRKPRWTFERVDHAVLRVTGSALAAVLVGVVTHWPVAAVAVLVLGIALPSILGSRHARELRSARLSAVAAWAEMLRDTLTAGLGIETAIRASALAAPLAIRPEVELLAAELRGPDLLDEALRRFASRVDNPTSDRVVAALLLPRGSSSLSQRLSAIATAARDDVDMRLRVDAEREGTRWTARLVVVITAAMALGLALLNRTYLAPYDSVTGQLVLVVVILLFAGGYTWLGRITAEPSPARLMIGTEERG
ncbi:MAG: type II secretion system F family protein [Solirubrobacteraceae bacterium]